MQAAGAVLKLLQRKSEGKQGQFQRGDTSPERREERVADVSPAPASWAWYNPHFRAGFLTLGPFLIESGSYENPRVSG